MKHTGGFTLIELVITASIVVLLLAVAIPRFNAFNTTQNFRFQTQGLANCLQKAQQIAMAPSEESTDQSGVSYGVVELRRLYESQTKVPHTECTVFAAKKIGGDGLPPDVGSTSPGASSKIFSVDLQDMQICDLQSAGASLLSYPHSDIGDILVIDYSVTQKGIPFSVYQIPVSSVPMRVKSQTSDRHGFDLRLTLSNTSTMDDSSIMTCDGLTTTINMAPLGVPIQVL